MTSRGTLVALCCALLFTGLTACKLDPYNTGGAGRWLDAGPGPDGGDLRDRDISVDACVPTTEVCDGVDNDCNNVVDDASNLATDASNCGVCGNACAFPYAQATCDASACVMGDCFPGHFDIDGDAANGCEYTCTLTNGSVEACDGRDNDCNGEVDEGYDLQADPNNCGSCRNTCVFLNGVGTCSAGICTMGGCKGGYRDVDGNVNNGCECQIQLTGDASTLATCVQGMGTCAAGEECADPDRDGTSHCYLIPADVCDGRDNDCDGTVDEDAATGNCYTFSSGCSETTPGNYACSGECLAGALQCSAGVLRCLGQRGPSAELCNSRDDDCNGATDEAWDKLNDPNNCGGCGISCSFANAVPRCDAGQCAILQCLPGYYNINGDPGDGCEYGCTLTNGGVERCGDGLDNNCNGAIDEGFDTDTDPENCGACGYSCAVERPRGAQATLDATGDPVCQTGRCNYECQPDNWDLNGDLADLRDASNIDGCEYFCQTSNGGVEACDGQDNDCNGQVDETFNFQTDAANCGTCGRSCEAIKPPNSVSDGCTTGKCVYHCEAGFVDLNADLNLPGSNGCECQIQPETCGDGVDNDCNGIVDDANAIGCTTYYKDRDLDTFGDSADTACLCGPNATQRYTALQGGDCADQNPSINPAAVEVCDGRDNDCDGNVDNATSGQAAPLLSRTCYTGPTGTESRPPCQTGTQFCNPATGVWATTCQGQVTPVVEICDGVDNDCDGTADDGFNLATNMQHCGACNTPCSIPNAIATCQGGSCIVDRCIPPWYNYDGNNTDCEYNCVIQGAPLCDGTGDRNCNGLVDSTEFNKQTDPFNCGTCGTVCAVLAPFGTVVDTSAGTGCTGGVCQFRCATGFVNVDGNILSNGCECVFTNNGVEVCDNEDNNCNGQIDEGIDKQTDPLNCGACDRKCSNLGDAATLAAHHVVFDGCITGNCRYSCMPGYYDLNNDRNSGRPFGSLPGQSNGCEYACSPAAPGAEVCDGQDNDCDGFTDRDGSGQPLSQTCYEGPGGTSGVGVCRSGVSTCSGGTYGVCLGQVLPQGAPLCGSTDDNNCNSVPDDTEFNTATDAFNCGACGNNCYANAPANMIPNPSNACSGGTCNFVCVSGYRDLTGGQTDGCEYACPVNPPKPAGFEDCNGLDDDCDGQIDEEPDLTNNKPSALTHCSFPRVGGTACDGVAVTCSTGPGGAYPLGWYCDWATAASNYRPVNPPVIQYDTNRPNVILSQESLCDGDDNDCDGFADEPFVQKGQGCDDGELGACRGTGTYQCNTDATGVECVITSPGSAPDAELCDGLDNDCDGLVDEPASSPGADPSYVVDDLVEVTTATGSVWVYRYEASRPDSTDADPGVMTHRSCSNEGALPWANVSYVQAKDACEAAGYRLCSQNEWQTACEGGAGNTYEYPYLHLVGYSDYDPSVCNGNDYDYNCTGLDDDDVLPTGRVYTDCTTPPSDCISVDGILDLSGNLMEWTSTAAAAGIYHVRGGSFLTHEWGLTCQAQFVTLQQNFRYDDLGFRCCSDTAP